MIFLFVPICEVSARLMLGRGTLRDSTDFTSTVGGVIALGAMAGE